MVHVRCTGPRDDRSLSNVIKVDNNDIVNAVYTWTDVLILRLAPLILAHNLDRPRSDPRNRFVFPVYRVLMIPPTWISVLSSPRLQEGDILLINFWILAAIWGFFM